MEMFLTKIQNKQTLYAYHLPPLVQMFLTLQMYVSLAYGLGESCQQNVHVDCLGRLMRLSIIQADFLKQIIITFIDLLLH